MKNKKGISIGRIILIGLFLSILGILIYSIYLGYKGLKDKTPETQKSSMRMAYNNAYDYSAADFISLCSSYWCYDNSWAWEDIDPFIRGSDYTTTMQPITTDGSYNDSLLYHPNIVVNDNVLNIGSNLNYIGSHIMSVYGDGNHNPSTSALNSTFIFYRCNMSISLFKGSISGTDYNQGSWNTIIWYVTDKDVDPSGNILRSHKYRFTSTGSFDLASNLDNSVSDATRLYYFGFGMYQNRSSTDNAFVAYPNQKALFLAYAVSGYYDDLYINFDVVSGNNDYQSGFDAGYVAGKNDVDQNLINQNVSLSNEVSILNNSVNDLTSRVEQQQLVITQLQSQINNQTNFKGLFFTMADIPFRTISNALGFEFWGVNLFRFFTGIITALGILWLIKRLYK